MLSLNATQQAIVASDYKLVSWLFDITTTAPVSYYWSIKDKNYGGHDYTYKVSDFDNITLKKSNSEYGIQSPNDLIFTIVNKDNTLNADDFVDAYVLLRLVVSDGTDEEVIRTWKFKIKQSEPHNQTIKFTCVDFAQDHIEGDYPNTKLIKDISPSDDGTPDDTLCVPLPFGTCYIPLRSIYITDARYYVLGLASHTYTITKVHSPRDWGNTSVWNSGSYTFTQSTKTIDAVNWRVFQPIIADSDNDGVVDACGLWKSGDVFLDPLVQFSRNDTASTTSPADIIEFVLKDMGVASGDIDATTFGIAKATYTSWGLTLNGAYFYKMPREQALAMLLNMCHSMLIPREKLELHVLSKTSQWTLNKSHILQGGRGESSFDYNLITQEKSDSGYIGYQVVDMPQDNLIKAIVPAKATTDEVLDETLDVSFINNSQDAQRAGSLYYQRKLLKKSNNYFNSKGTLLSLDPDDMITIDHADYGGAYDILVDTITINRDAVISFDCNRYSDDLDDWDDLTPGAINIASDDSGNVWASVTYGPSSSVSSGVNPNQIGDGFFAGKTDLWGGHVYLNNAATKIVLGDLDATPKIALGASADSITHAGTEEGFYADGDGKVRFGDADGYVRFTPGSPSTLDVKGVLTASEIHIPDQDTTANSCHVRSDADTWWGCTETNFTTDNDNATAYILKNGVAKFQNIILTANVTIDDIQAGSEIAIQGWQHDLVFSSTDANTASWGSGTITLMSGATYNIVAGNTGNMAARTYIYLDIGTSSTVLQTTITATNAVGSGKILIGVAEDSTTEATYQVFGGAGGLGITGGNIESNSITANEIAANTITAGEINAGTITLTEMSYVPYIIATDDLDDISDGTNYSKVATTSITAGQIVLTAGVTGSLPVGNSDAKCTDANADQTSVNTAANAAAYTGASIATGYTAAKCTDADADQTSANNQAVGWLTDAGNLATLNTVNATYIDAGSITLVKCATETTNRQFSSDANRTNVEAWRHVSDVTKIDGGDIYANSISVDKITSSFNPNLIPSRFADFERFDNGDTLPVGNGTAVIDNTASFVGVQSLKMVASAANNYSFLGISSTDYNVTLEPSTKYILSLYAKCGAGWTPDIKVEIKQDDTTLKLSAAQEITPSWVRYTFELTTDAGLTDAGLVVLHNMDSGATIWWDAVQIEKANAAASPEASQWTPGTLNGSQFGNLTITAGKLAINTTDALEIQAAGNVLVKQGGDIVMEGGASGNPSLLRFADEAVPGEIRLEQSGDASKYWQITKGTAFDDLIVKPIGLNTPYAWFGTSTNRIEAFYVHSSAVCRFYVAGVSSLIIYNTSLTAGVDLKPNGHKTLDIGSATAAYDIMFSDDFTNVADFYQFDDRDDLAALHQIKGSGVIDPLTGYELIDDLTLPAWLLKKRNKDGEERDEDDNIISTYKRGDDCRDPDGKPYLSLKTMISLCMGAIRQLDKKVEALNIRIPN